MWCARAGNAADGQYPATRRVARFKRVRRALRSAALQIDSSVLSCVANDYICAAVFARQIEALGRAGDLLVGSSTPYNSGDVLRALQSAKELGLHTVGLPGKSKALVDHAIVTPSNVTARIQEARIVTGHCFCDLVEDGLDLPGNGNKQP